MDVSALSSRYRVRRMGEADVSEVYALCRQNPLYYQHCPPPVTPQRILEEMRMLPRGKTASDKYYVVYYRGDELIAVLDLIMAYPDEKTAFIGFFMTAAAVQNAGVGSEIIDELCNSLSAMGLSGVRLCWVRGNPQAEHFWRKNRFAETGVTCDGGLYTVVVAHRDL